MSPGSTMTSFNFEALPIRVVEQGGETWFVASDICAALGLSNPSVTVKALDDDEKAKLNLGSGSDATIINEAGVYTIILRCRDAMTPGTVPYRFRKWVTGEVLPALRKNGRYGAPDPIAALNDPATMRNLLLSYSEKVLELEQAKASLTPKAEALDRIATADGSLCITDAAKALQLRPKDLFDWLQRHHWIYRRHGTGWLGYQAKVQLGYLEHKVTTVATADGRDKVSEQVRITPKGMARLAEAFTQKAA